MSAYRFKLALVREPAPEPFGSQISDPGAAAALAARLLADEFQEVSLAMFFNRQNQLIGFSEIGRGGLAHSPMEPREVLVAALTVNAAAVIVAHNHPSGSLQPSVQDIAITRRLQHACQLVGLELLDHLLIAAGGDYRSMLHGS
jgi:DNA repair protein RadC